MKRFGFSDKYSCRGEKQTDVSNDDILTEISFMDEAEAAGQFQDRYALMLLVARRYASHPDDVYDIVQQSFIEFLKYASTGKLDQTRDLTPLIYQITKIQAFKWRKEREKHSSKSIQAVSDELLNYVDTRESPESFQQQIEEIAVLRNCIEKLATRHKELIESHYIHGMSMARLSEKMNRKAKDIRTIFCRIRDKLRRCIEQTTASK